MGARVGRSITLSSSQTESHSSTRSSLNQGGGDADLGGKKPPAEKTETTASCKRVPGGGCRSLGTASVIQRHATTGRFGLLPQKTAKNEQLRPPMKEGAHAPSSVHAQTRVRDAQILRNARDPTEFVGLCMLNPSIRGARIFSLPCIVWRSPCPTTNSFAITVRSFSIRSFRL